MPGQLVPVNAALIQFTSANSANAVMERDNNGDTYAARFRAATSLVSGGGLQVGQVAKTTNFTGTEANEEVWFDCTSGNLTFTLPPAATSIGWVLDVVKTDSTVNTLTLDGNAAELVNGDLTQVLHFQWEHARLVCDGTKWHMRRTVQEGVVAKSANFTVGGAGNFYNITVGAGVITVTLPAAAGFAYKKFWLKRVDAGAGSVTVTGGTVDGTANPTLLFNGAGTQYDVLEFRSDGTNWSYGTDRGPAT